jgi:glycosyltransferase involved in cell wall biosynthesis
MKLLYVANIRLPTEKAHGLQIVQNCEAFASAGADVTLWVARRVNTPELRAVHDVWAHYGVRRNFALRRLPCIDLLPLVPDRSDRLAQAIFMIQLWTFTLAAWISLAFMHADVIYSRDEAILLLASLIKPRHVLAYEAHTLAQGRLGRAIQRRVVRRVGSVIAVTHRLADDLIDLGASADCVHVAHDGIRRERFAKLPEQAAARREVGWASDAFIVGYVGRLQTMAMDKGVATLVEALAKVEGCSLALVGGPDDTAAELRARWIELGQDAARLLYAGQVAPERVPLYLSAFDVCAMPFPWTTHFAYYASPIKLFEYMASRRALVASNLPSVAEVVTDGESALLVPPSDVDALAAAIRRLKGDAALRERLVENAHGLVMERYTWEARATAILSVMSDA